MFYPNFLKCGDKIGVTAPSFGIPEKKRESFMLSINNIEKAGYNVTLTDNVFKTECIASTPATTRASQFRSLVTDKDTKLVWAATGGDFTIEMLEHIDYDEIKNNPKWYMGYSDITGVLFPITIMCDMATIYGPNAGGLDMTTLHPSLENALSVIKGDIPTQSAFPLHERERIKNNDGYNLDTKTTWDSSCGDFSATGRLIGGCIDCLQIYTGTKYGDVSAFLEKYKNDGFIWYFDVYALTSEQLNYALWTMKHAGWFKYAKAIMFSRVLFPGSVYDLSYKDAVKRAIPDIPFVLDTDTGHVKPQFTLINGSLATLTVKGDSGSLKQKLV